MGIETSGIGFGLRVSVDSSDGAAAVDDFAGKIDDVKDSSDQASASVSKLTTNIAAVNAQMAATGQRAEATKAGMAGYTASVRALDDELTKFLAVNDKTYRNQLLLDQGNDLLTRGFRAGLLSAQQYESQLKNLQERFGGNSSAVNSLGISAGFAGREIHAMVDELASGRIGQFQGTIANILGRIAQVNPVGIAATVVVAALGATFIGTAAHAEALDRALASTQARFAGVGNEGLVGTAQLRATIAQLDSLAGVSKADAEKIISAIASIPQSSQGLFTQLTAMVTDFATATGVEAPKAAEELAKAFENPFQGAKQLDAQLNILTSDQLLQLEQMKRTGDVIGAQQLLYEALQKRVEGLHEQGLTPLQKATEGLGATWNKMNAEFGQSGFIQALITGFTTVIGIIDQILIRAPKLKDVIANAAELIPGLQGIGIWAESLPDAKPAADATATGSGAAGGKGGNSAFDQQTKSLLEATASLKSHAQAMREDAATAANLRIAMIKMEEAGDTTSATYKRFGDALVALNEKMAGPLQSRIAALDKTTALEVSGYQQSYNLLKDSLDRKEKALDASYAAGLTSEQSYIAQRQRNEEEGATNLVATIDKEIAARQKERDEVAGLSPTKAGGANQQREKLAELDQQLLDLSRKRTIAERNVGQAATDASTRAYQAASKEFDFEVKITNQLADYLRAQKQNLDDQQFQLSLIGKTEEAAAAAQAARQVRIASENEINKLLRERADLSAQGNEDPARYMAIDDSVARIKANMPAAAAAAADFAAQISLAGQNANTLTQAFQTVDNFMSTLFSKFKDGWKSAAQYAAEQIRTFITQALYEATVQRVLLSIAGSAGVPASALAGASPITSTFNSLSNYSSLFGSGGSLTTSLFGSASEGTGAYLEANELAGVSTSGLIGSGGLGGGISGVAGFAGAIGDGAGAIAGSLGAGAAAAGEFAATVAAAVPVIGWVVAIGLVLYSIFGSKGGGPKGGGSVNDSFDAAGKLTGNPTVPGTDNGRFFTPNQADSALQTVVAGFGKTYADTVKGLGGKPADNVTFGLGYDTDPAGTANDRTSALATVNGKTVYDVRDLDTGSRDSSVTQTQLTDQASRAMLAALQASDLPPAVAKIIDGLDVKTATSQAIQDAETLAGIVATIVNEAGDIAGDAQKLYDSNISQVQALDQQRTAVLKLADQYDGTTASAQQLASAQQTYRNSLIQLLAQIKQVTAAIDSMFGDTEESIRRAGLDGQGLYDYLQKDADTKYQQLLASNDPAEVSRLAQQINDDIGQAFGLLSPQQQLDEKPEYISHIEDVDNKIDQHLADISAALTASGSSTFEDVADKLGGAGTTLKEAGADLKDAASDMTNAASNMNTAASNLAGAATLLGGPDSFPRTVTG